MKLMTSIFFFLAALYAQKKHYEYLERKWELEQKLAVNSKFS
jgi:hypothetical protein